MKGIFLPGIVDLSAKPNFETGAEERAYWRGAHDANATFVRELFALLLCFLKLWDPSPGEVKALWLGRCNVTDRAVRAIVPTTPNRRGLGIVRLLASPSKDKVTVDSKGDIATYWQIGFVKWIAARTPLTDYDWFKDERLALADVIWVEGIGLCSNQPWGEEDVPKGKHRVIDTKGHAHIVSTDNLFDVIGTEYSDYWRALGSLPKNKRPQGIIGPY